MSDLSANPASAAPDADAPHPGEAREPQQAADDTIRLTALAHGGGCGCKLSPAVLRDLLAAMPHTPASPDLLVGSETADDAAVYRVTDNLAVISTTDFFMPIVDDPRDFGRIAAANALSDVYAMGGRPIMALAIVGMPLGKVSPTVVGRILAGGAEMCAQAGIPVAGGHSIDCPEPVYGLAVTGLVDPSRLLRNRDARAGDALVLTKPLGVGIAAAALKQRGAGSADTDRLYAAMLASTTQLNSIGAELGAVAGVHAMTDVTGFGLLGHLLEMCRGAGLSAQIDFAALPLLAGVEALARAGVRTGASTRNWDSYGGGVQGVDGWRRDLLCDPQTSGGLLIAVAPDCAGAVVDRARSAGFAEAAIIGGMVEGGAEITVR